MGDGCRLPVDVTLQCFLRNTVFDKYFLTNRKKRVVLGKRYSAAFHRGWCNDPSNSLFIFTIHRTMYETCVNYFQMKPK